MPDETNVGTSGEPTPTPDVSAPPAGQPTVGAETARDAEAVGTGAPAIPAPQTPTLPEKFRGKSAEEIASAYMEVEREKGRLADEAGRYRSYAEQLWAEKQQALAERQQAQPPAPTAPPKPEEFDWERPAETVKQIVDRQVRDAMGGFMGAIQEARKVEVVQKAAQSWEDGVKTFGKNTRLFEGIERDVQNLVEATYAPMVQRGIDVSEYHRNPKTWETAAAIIRYSRGTPDDLARITGSGTPPRGMSAPATEVPGGNRPSNQGSAIVLDDESKELARHMGIKDGEARELIELGKKTRRDLR